MITPIGSTLAASARSRSPQVTLGAGETALYLYDSISDLGACCECSNNFRVFFDYAKLYWLGP